MDRKLLYCKFSVNLGFIEVLKIQIVKWQEMHVVQ